MLGALTQTHHVARRPVKPWAVFGSTGAAFAVGIGYMDPGNWSTDLNATAFGDSLLWAVIGSGVAAIVLQLLVVQLATATGEDLAAAILRRWPRFARPLWLIYAFAIVATESAEFTGVTIGVSLMFHIAVVPAALAAIAIFFALLLAGGVATGPLERLCIATTCVLAFACVTGWVLLHPAAGPIVSGAFIPTVRSGTALLAVIGIIGATIMPHNLFLHSGIVAERFAGLPHEEREPARRGAIRETVLALLVATAINVAILVVGNAVHAGTIEHAYAAVSAAISTSAGLGFGIALVIAALAATATGARAGDFVFASGAPVRLNLFARRSLGVLPAALLLVAGTEPSSLLVASQIALGIVLPFAAVPLVVLAVRHAIHRTLTGRMLVVASFSTVALTLLCNGAYLSSFFTH